MIKSIVKDSILLLLSKPKLIRISFFTTFGHTIYRSYLVAYFFNYILNQRYEAGIQLSNAFVYLITKVQELNMRGFIISLLIIVIIGNFLIYPIGEAAITYAVQDKGNKLAGAITKGIKKFFVMLEFNGLGFAFGFYTVITIIIRIRMMGILDNIMLQIILLIRGIIVILANIFRPYTKYYIISQDLGVFDAIKKSIYLTMTNFSLTVKGFLFEIMLMGRFFLNAFIAIALPLGLIYIAIFFNIINNALVEGIIRISAVAMLLVISYLNGIFEAFFTNYRYQLFQEAEKKLNE
ncbi:MAG: hypothetical protein LBP53_08445 [Candidatus Peribacteria bacterium]|jgi:hypothetical protein|nr:hypothetical protein [Candidatus Peribacteria bacterium]